MLRQSMHKSFSMGEIPLNMTNRSSMRTHEKWHKGAPDLTKRSIAVRLLANVAQREIPATKPSAFLTKNLN